MPVGLGAIPVDPSLEDGGASLRVTIANHFQFRTKMLLEYQCQQKQEAPKQTKLLYVDKSLQQLTGHYMPKEICFQAAAIVVSPWQVFQHSWPGVTSCETPK